MSAETTRHAAAATKTRARKRKRGVRYSKAVANRICERLARGERWSKIAGGPKMPAEKTPYLWIERYPEFRDAWMLAHRIGAEVRADKVLALAEATTPETLAVDRVHMGALKWHVERDDKRLIQKDGPDLGTGRRLIIEVRRFERYTAPDGSTQVREILPKPAGEGR